VLPEEQSDSSSSESFEDFPPVTFPGSDEEEEEPVRYNAKGSRKTALQAPVQHACEDTPRRLGGKHPAKSLYAPPESKPAKRKRNPSAQAKKRSDKGVASVFKIVKFILPKMPPPPATVTRKQLWDFCAQTPSIRGFNNTMNTLEYGCGILRRRDKDATDFDVIGSVANFEQEQAKEARYEKQLAELNATTSLLRAQIEEFKKEREAQRPDMSYMLNAKRDRVLERNEKKVEEHIKLCDRLLHDEFTIPKTMILKWDEKRELSFRLEPEDLEDFFEHPDTDDFSYVPPRGKAHELLRD
jgi:hypothetical protein